MMRYLGRIDDELANDAIEDALGIRSYDQVNDGEPSLHRTIGDLEAWAISRTALQQGRCASSMAFYRLRRALGGDRRITPSTPLDPLLGARPKTVFVKLKRSLGMTLPDASTWVSAIGGSALWLALAGIPFLGLHLPWQPLALMALLGVALLLLDPGRRPARITTVGDLATVVAGLNLAKLGKAGGAIAERDVRRTIREILAVFSGRSPDEITSDMHFGEAP